MEQSQSVLQLFKANSPFNIQQMFYTLVSSVLNFCDYCYCMSPAWFEGVLEKQMHFSVYILHSGINSLCLFFCLF